MRPRKARWARPPYRALSSPRFGTGQFRRRPTGCTSLRPCQPARTAGSAATKRRHTVDIPSSQDTSTSRPRPRHTTAGHQHDLVRPVPSPSLCTAQETQSPTTPPALQRNARLQSLSESRGPGPLTFRNGIARACTLATTPTCTQTLTHLHGTSAGQERLCAVALLLRTACCV